MSEPYMTEIIKKFSDGSEIVIELHENPDAEEIVRKVSEAQAEIADEDLSEVTASEPMVEVEESTVSSTEDVENVEEEVEA